MSTADAGGPVARREVAYRLFAAEYDGADLEYSDSDEERAPNYVVTPTGARINRLFAVGVLTEVEPVSDDVLRARVADPTGAFVVYAGQYQPDAVAFLETAEVPSYVAVTGKARTFRPDGSDRVFTSVRPESMTTVDAATRDRWTVQAAFHTLARVATMARALDREERGDDLAAVLRASDVDPGLASGIALAIDHYGTTPAYLSAIRGVALGAAAVAAGDRESAPTLDLVPDEDGPVTGDLTSAPAVAGGLAGPIASSGGVEQAEPAAPADAAAPAAGDDPAEGDTAAPTADESAAGSDGASEAKSGDLGAFDSHEVSTDPAGTEPYQLDDDERAAVEAEYGTEFSTGSEVGDPGEAGIEPEAGPPPTEADETPPPAADAPEASTETAPDEEPADDGMALEDAAVGAMAELDDGDGADYDAVVQSVADAHGASDEAVEAAIEDALMGGRCYEPEDGLLKAI